MRGPIATKIVQQLLLATDWGALDYLIVDMPPGTGDIHITLSQLAAFSGAVVVSTPHPLALVDAAKGMALLQTVHIPTLAVVENMAYFAGEDGKVYYPFGQGGRAQLLRAVKTLSPSLASSLAEELQLAAHHALPLVPPVGEEMPVDTPIQAREAPVVLSAPDSDAGQSYRALARAALARLFTLQTQAILIPSVQWDRDRGGVRLRYFTATQAFERFVPLALLETADAKTGRLAEGGSTAAARSSPVLQVESKGQYGLSIAWKHQTKIFPYDVLRQIADDVATAQGAGPRGTIR